MAKKGRGRPTGSSGTAVPFHPHDIQSVLKVARRERYASRAELLVMLSMTLGLRASELARMAIKDVYASDGSVLRVITVSQSFSLGKRSLVDLSDLHRLRRCMADYFEKQLGEGSDPGRPLFRSQQGGALTAQGIARYLTSLYRRAGIVGASSRSGRKTFDRAKQGLKDLARVRKRNWRSS
jgi:integrase/recombinase XerD